MNQDKDWLLMTYYCPLHGEIGKVEPIEIRRQDISNELDNIDKSKKNI